MKVGDKVKSEFAAQEMTVIGFEPEFVENVITQYEDEIGNLITAKFAETELQIVEENQKAQP